MTRNRVSHSRLPSTEGNGQIDFFSMQVPIDNREEAVRRILNGMSHAAEKALKLNGYYGEFKSLRPGLKLDTATGGVELAVNGGDMVAARGLGIAASTAAFVSYEEVSGSMCDFSVSFVEGENPLQPPRVISGTMFDDDHPLLEGEYQINEYDRSMGANTEQSTTIHSQSIQEAMRAMAISGGVVPPDAATPETIVRLLYAASPSRSSHMAATYRTIDRPDHNVNIELNETTELSRTKKKKVHRKTQYAISLSDSVRGSDGQLISSYGLSLMRDHRNNSPMPLHTANVSSAFYDNDGTLPTTINEKKFRDLADIFASNPLLFLDTIRDSVADLGKYSSEPKVELL